MIDDRELVCIYGAASPETDSKIIHHLLGVLEVERVPIDSWEKMSDAAKERNVALGRRDKWRYAMPVRRAWRTNHTLDVKQIFPRSYDPKNGRYIAKFGTWLVLPEARWLIEKVPFTETNVFGEPPVNPVGGGTARTGLLASLLTPSRGIFGSFGVRSFDLQDKPYQLYLAVFPSFPELLAGGQIGSGKGIVKIGISSDLKNRLKALNLSFPKTATIGWKITRTAQFPNRASAGDAENLFKEQAINAYGAQSLGNEFFKMDLSNADALFNKLSPPTGLQVKITSKVSR